MCVLVCRLGVAEGLRRMESGARSVRKRRIHRGDDASADEGFADLELMAQGILDDTVKREVIRDPVEFTIEEGRRGDLDAGDAVTVIAQVLGAHLREPVALAVGHKFLNADVYFIDYLPSQVQAQDVLMVGGAALVLSFLATLYPAWRAARTQPAQALRYE